MVQPRGRIPERPAALPYTPQTLALIIDHVDQVQTALARPILLENPATYLLFQQSEIPETQFLQAIAPGHRLRAAPGRQQPLCLGGEPSARSLGMAGRLSLDLVQEIHLGGHATEDLPRARC